MTQVTISEGKLFRHWLLYFVTVTVTGFIVGALAGGAIGFAIGFSSSLTGHKINHQLLIGVAKVVAFIAVVPISYACYRWTVKRLISKM